MPLQGHHSAGHHVLETSERVAGHLLAIVVGFALMVLGVGLGVTIVLLPAGLLIGLAGLFLFLWGFFVAAPAPKSEAGRPSDPRP